MKDFLRKGAVPVTLFIDMLTFRDSNRPFKLDGDLSEMKVTNNFFNVSHSYPQDQELIYEFGKEMNFNFKQKGRKRPGDQSLIKLLKSPAITASGVSTIFYYLILMNYVIH